VHVRLFGRARVVFVGCLRVGFASGMSDWRAPVCVVLFVCVCVCVVSVCCECVL
jgi:hypothetical protein